MHRYKVSIVVDNCKDEQEALDAVITFIHDYQTKLGTNARPLNPPKFEEMCTDCYDHPCTCDDEDESDAESVNDVRYYGDHGRYSR